MNYAVLSYDLATDRRGDAAEVRMQGGRVLQVVQLPATASDVAIKVDDGDFIPVTGLLRLEFRDAMFSKVTLRNAPTTGTLQLFAGTEPFPFVSAAAGAAGLAAVLSDYEMMWPDFSTTFVAGVSAFPQIGKTRWGDGNPNFFNAPAGAGSSGVAVWKGRVCGRLTPVRSVGPTCIFSPLLTRPLASEFLCPRSLRVWRISVMLARSAVSNWTAASGIQLAPGAAASPGWINTGNPAVGIFGDGAGGWRYISKNVAGGAPGGFSEVVPLTWPDLVTEWVEVTFEIVSASGAAEAKLNLYLNSRPVLTRLWGPGTLLPGYSDPVNSTRFEIGIAAADALPELFYLAAARVTVGPFLLSGQEA